MENPLEHPVPTTADAAPSVPGTEDADRFWDSIRTQVSVALREYVNERYKRHGEEERNETYREALIGEEALVKDTLSRVEHALGHTPTMGRILFDIDDTLGKVAFDPERKNITGFSFRPSILPLIDYLRRMFPSLKIGFLTTRGRQPVLEQLRKESFLGPLAAYIDATEVYSTDDIPEIFSSNIEGEFEYLAGHPDVDPTALDQENFYGHMPGEISKLEILKQLHERTPAVPTVVVDDFSYPQYLKNGVRAKIF